MGHIEATKHLSASPEALWATVSDLQSWDKWFTVHERWLEEPPTVVGAGSKITAKIVMLGMANKIEWEIREVEEPQKIVLGGTGMAGVKCEFTFGIEPDGTGSKFTVSGDFEGAMIKGALGKAVEKDGMKQLEKSLAQLDEFANSVA